MWAEGKPVPGRLLESIRLYAICKAMKWTHLPVQGGLYDQHPQLVDDFVVIMQAESVVERKRIEEQRRQANKQSRVRRH